MSHIITFQSFDEVNTNRELRDQLLKTMNTHSILDGLCDALNASDTLDVALKPANCCTRFKIPDGCRAITTARSYETTRAIKSCEGTLGREGSLDGSWVGDVERICAE